MSTPPSPPLGGRRRTAVSSTIARCTALALVLAPASASAQLSDADKASARALAQQGQDALDKRDFATAADRFARAGELVHAPTLALGLARAQVGSASGSPPWRPIIAWCTSRCPPARPRPSPRRSPTPARKWPRRSPASPA